MADLSSLLKNSTTPELRELLKSAGTAGEAGDADADAAKSNAMMLWTFIFPDCSVCSFTYSIGFYATCDATHLISLKI